MAITILPATPSYAQQMMAGVPIDGIKCESMEGAVLHIHQHLTLFDHGRPVGLPAQIGIPAGTGCLYWLHTHSNDGVLHIESPVRRSFTLGEFFDVWAQPLSSSVAGPVRASRGRRLRITVNGKAYGRDPRRIALKDHEEIVIQSGPPFAHPYSGR
ncbi:MAG: hypothetical protein DLM50_05095 [Candidatus Meridianibacter frigidus]|nr:MAG: hypothetical protein DLM50_05095 [Candidatus Eremiobacteraeota bacterium]